MSAFKYLVYVVGVVVVAVFGAVLNEFVTPFLNQASAQSTTQASATGITWFTQFWTWIALVALLLLAFALIVGVVNRRQQVIR
jgi:quinol-cytochrome oxidoreductase complex cytochrome b subunit